MPDVAGWLVFYSPYGTDKPYQEAKGVGLLDMHKQAAGIRHETARAAGPRAHTMRLGFRHCSDLTRVEIVSEGCVLQ